MRGSTEFNEFEQYIKTTDFYRNLSKLGVLELINYVYRQRKKAEGTKLHTDKFTLSYCMFYINYLNCWSPLVDLSLEEGPLCFADFSDKKVYQQEESSIFIFNKNYIRQKYNNDLSLIFSNYYEFEQGLKGMHYGNAFKEKYHSKIYSMPLKKGDVAIFSKNIIHGALDSNKNSRSSIDFRFGVNLPKEIPCVKEFFKLNKCKLDDSSTHREVFDYQALELMK